MTTIIYTPALEGQEHRDTPVNITDYKSVCEKRETIFEKLPDDRPIKLYMDFDFKKCKHAAEGAEIDDCTERLIALGKKHICKQLAALGATILPQFASKSSTQIENGIISFHLICTNYKMMKKEQKVFFKNVERSIEADTEDAWRRDYLEVKPDAKFIDDQVYSRNRFLRSSYSTKPGEIRHFEIVEGTFEDTVISFDNCNATVVSVPIPVKPVKTLPCTVSGIEAEEISAYLDAGMFKTLAEDYKTWIEMGFAIYGACGAKGLPLFLQFSALCTEKYDKYDCIEWFERLESRPDGFGMGSIKYWAKQENPTEYERISKLFAIKKAESQNARFIEADDLSDPYKCALVISKTLKNALVLCSEKWYMLTESQLWKTQKEPSFYIIDELRKYIDESNKATVERIQKTDGEQKEKLIEKSKIYLKSYKTISSSGFLNVITKYLKTLLFDDNFADKLDANHDFLAFKNGIMDLKTKTFREGILWSDFITNTIPFDYSRGTEHKKEYVKSVLKKILNNNADHLEYFLSIIGYSFIGSPQLEKSIYFCVDKTEKASGDNGKTFYFDILTHLFPNYVYKSKGSLLEEGNTKVHKQLVMMKGKRLVWLDEFGKKKSNAELIKELGDGLNIENEIMFGTSEAININFKLFALTNNMPSIDPKDTAVYNRYKQISYGSHFDRTGMRREEDPENLLFIAKTELGDTLKTEYANEIFDLVIEYAHKYYTHKLPAIPAQFVKDTRDTQKNNDPFANWFEENCEEDNYSRIPLKQITSMCFLSEKEVKEGMTRLGFKYKPDLSKMGKDCSGKAYKGGFEGVKIRIPSIEAGEETEEEDREE